LLAKGATTREKAEKADSEYLAALAELEAGNAAVASAEAKVIRVKENIKDSHLVSPVNGRVQYRVAEQGEILKSGGKVFNVIDLSDVYITFFLPETIAGKVKIGNEVRIVLDAVPDTPIPAKVTFVDSVAQFTPKTVETKEERQKLMFRVKAKIDPELLVKYEDRIMTGLPGEAWVKYDDNAQWPDFLVLKKDRK
jgi:HlyD family secretion protein